MPAADPFDLAAKFAPAPVRRAAGRPADEAAYICDACGEEIVVPVDRTAGAVQQYVEDCPVCCRPNVLTVRVDPDGAVSLHARPE